MTGEEQPGRSGVTVRKTGHPVRQLRRLTDKACWQLTVFDAWWHLHGRWSPPVLLLSPRRRRITAELKALYAHPDFADDMLRRVEARIIQRQREEAFWTAMLGGDTPDTESSEKHDP